MKNYLKIINGKKYVCFKERKNSRVEIRFEFPDKEEYCMYWIEMFLGNECIVYDKDLPIAYLKIKCDTEILYTNKVFPCDLLIDFITFISKEEHIPEQIIISYSGTRFDMYITINTRYDDKTKACYFDIIDIEREK